MADLAIAGGCSQTENSSWDVECRKIVRVIRVVYSEAGSYIGYSITVQM